MPAKTQPSPATEPGDAALGRQELPSGLADALAAYEKALMSNDVAALDNWFLDSPQTLRADGNGVLVGRDRIASFRRTSQGAPRRSVTNTHIVPLSGDAVVTVAETRRPDGTPGLQTQAWVDTPDGWRIAAAHVSVGTPPAPGRTHADPATNEQVLWREVGEPLVSATRRGRLDGLAIAVKDMFAVAGHPIGAGNPTWLSQASPEPRHAVAVQALLDAGASVTGIAQTDELAYSLSGTNTHYGTPENPAAPGRVPGGSSSGPASAVALGLVDIGLGTDTAGSIRVPASYCGLFGLRPSHGAISTTGLIPLAPSFDAVGWMTRDPETLDAVAQVLLPDSDMTPPDRLVLADDVLGLASPDISDLVRRSATRLSQRLGLKSETLADMCQGHLDDWVEAFRTVQAAEAWVTHATWLHDHIDTLDPEIAQRFSDGRAVTTSRRSAAEKVLLEARAHLWEAIPPGTVLAQPATSTTAPAPDMTATDKTAMRAGTLRLTSLASVAGLPSLTVPAGLVGGLPVGLCLVGSRGSDQALTSMARQFV